MPKPIHLNLTTISAILGLALLVAASIDLHLQIDSDFIETDCGKNEYCLAAKEQYNWRLAPSSLGIVAALIQVIHCAIVFTKCRESLNWKAWVGVHILIVVLTLSAFIISLNKGRTSTTITIFGGLDWIFCIVAPFVLYNLVKSGPNSGGASGETHGLTKY